LPRRLLSFIDTANAPIFVYSSAAMPKGLVNDWNNNAVEITDLTRQEVVGIKRHFLWKCRKAGWPRGESLQTEQSRVELRRWEGLRWSRGFN
jgi:PAS domain-containing protein